MWGKLWFEFLQRHTFINHLKHSHWLWLWQTWALNIFLNIFLVMEENNCGVTRHRVPFVLMRLQRWVWLSNNNYSFNNIFLHPPGPVSLSLSLSLSVKPWEYFLQLIRHQEWWQCQGDLSSDPVSSDHANYPCLRSFLCHRHWQQVFRHEWKGARKNLCGLSLFILNVMIVNRTCCENLWIESSLLTVRRAGIMQEKEWHVALNRNHYMKF